MIDFLLLKFKNLSLIQAFVLFSFHIIDFILDFDFDIVVFGPRQLAFEVEMTKHVAHTGQVISTGLLETVMPIFAQVLRSANHVPFVARLNMFSCLGVDVPFGQPKVDAVENICLFATPNHEVFWLDISMQKLDLVQLFYPGDHLVTQPGYLLDRKGILTKLE